MGFVSFSCTSLKAALWAGPQVQALDFPRMAQRGWVFSSNVGMNFPSWFAIPRNLLTPETDLGGSISRMASVLPGSALILLASITFPRNVRVFLLNSHFPRFSIAPASLTRLRTASSHSLCSFSSLPKTRTSSMWHRTPSRPSLEVFWGVRDTEGQFVEMVSSCRCNERGQQA